MKLLWWAFLGAMSWALVFVVVGAVCADTLIVEMDVNNNSIAVIEHEDGVPTKVDLRWDGLNNFGACATSDKPLGWVDPESGDFEVSVHARLGWVYPCSSFAYTNDAEVILTPDEINFDWYQKEEFTRPHAGQLTWDPIYGDANLDGAFNSQDMVAVFQFGQYRLTGGHSQADWYKGDWNADGLFNSSDIVRAFQYGAYEQPAAAVASVPEPRGLVLGMFGLFAMLAIHAWRIKEA